MQIEWRDELITGYEEIDAQHRELFARFNMLLTACNEGKGKDEVINLLGFMNAYVKSHFAAEERLQITTGYPQYAEHQDEHRKFTAEIDRLEQEFHTHGPTLALVIETNQTVVGWLIDHICKMDKALAKFVNSRS
jgi:hemerythrin